LKMKRRASFNVKDFGDKINVLIVTYTLYDIHLLPACAKSVRSL